jgi:hypothetical protein
LSGAVIGRLLQCGRWVSVVGQISAPGLTP